MKIRTDFVTNSSSSSFVIAYKAMPEIDEETLKKYPFIKFYPKLMESVLNSSGDYCEDTNPASYIKSYDDLEEFIEKEYKWGQYKDFSDIIANDEYAANEYAMRKEYLDKGYFIADKRVDYCDEGTSNFLRAFAEDNDSFILICGGE